MDYLTVIPGTESFSIRDPDPDLAAKADEVVRMGGIKPKYIRRNEQLGEFEADTASSAIDGSYASLSHPPLITIHPKDIRFTTQFAADKVEIYQLLAPRHCWQNNRSISAWQHMLEFVEYSTAYDAFIGAIRKPKLVEVNFGSHRIDDSGAIIFECQAKPLGATEILLEYEADFCEKGFLPINHVPSGSGLNGFHRNGFYLILPITNTPVFYTTISCGSYEVLSVCSDDRNDKLYQAVYDKIIFYENYRELAERSKRQMRSYPASKRKTTSELKEEIIAWLNSDEGRRINQKLASRYLYISETDYDSEEEHFNLTVYSEANITLILRVDLRSNNVFAQSFLDTIFMDGHYLKVGVEHSRDLLRVFISKLKYLEAICLKYEELSATIESEYNRLVQTT